MVVLDGTSHDTIIDTSNLNLTKSHQYQIQYNKYFEIFNFGSKESNK